MCLVQIWLIFNQVITTLIYRNNMYRLSEILTEFKESKYMSNYLQSSY